MTVVFGLGTRLHVRMRTRLENGVLRNGTQSNRNRTFTLRFNFAEVGVFLQNGRVLKHVNHLKENGEAAAS